MPAQLSDEASARDAEAVASLLDIDYQRVHLQPILMAFQEVIDAGEKPADDIHAIENALDRFRMTCGYYVANISNGLLSGHSTVRTDWLVCPRNLAIRALIVICWATSIRRKFVHSPEELASLKISKIIDPIKILVGN